MHREGNKKEILQKKNGFKGGDRYFYIWLGSVPLLRPGPYRGCTGIPWKAYQCMPFSKGLLCLPAHCQVPWGNSKRMDAHDEHCQSPTTPPAGVNVSDHNRLHEGGLRAQCPTAGPVVTAQHHGARWHLLQNRTGRSTNGGLRFSQRRMLPQRC